MSGASRWLDARLGAAEPTSATIPRRAPPASNRVLRMSSPVLGCFLTRVRCSKHGHRADGYLLRIPSGSEKTKHSPIVPYRCKYDGNGVRATCNLHRPRPCERTVSVLRDQLRGRGTGL